MDFDDSSETSIETPSSHSKSPNSDKADSLAFENIVQDSGVQVISFEKDFKADSRPTRSISSENETHHKFFEDDLDRPCARRGRLPGSRSQRLGTVSSGDYKTDGDMYPCLNSREMTLTDKTLISRLLVSVESQKSPNEEDSPEPSEETMVKYISLFTPQFLVRQSHEDYVLEMMQRTLELIASHAMTVQQALEDSFLTANEEKPEWASLCRGIRSVSIDPNFNLVAEIDVEPYAVNLYDIIAFTSQPLSEIVVLSFLKLIVVVINNLHEAGFVHGCLHGGNIMCCTDNGETILSGVGGVMSTLLFPSDPSFISPHLATAMRPLVDAAWNNGTTPVLESDDLYPWAPEGRLHDVILSLYGVRSGKDGKPVIQPRDDVYAIGILALTCLLGVPPFHGATLKEVVDTLTTNEDGKPTNLEPRALMGSVFSTTYARRRFLLAGYEEKFIDDMQDFILTCLNTEKFIEDPTEELLNHRLFSNYPIATPGSSGTKNWEEEKNIIDDTLHRVVYPVHRAMESVRSGCGTTPMLSRAYRNSIFAARWESLQSSWLSSPESVDDEGVGSDSVSVLWPYIDRAVSVWGGHLPESKLNIKANETVSPSLLYRANAKHCSKLQTLEEVAQSKGMITNMDEQTLVYHGKTHTRLLVHRDELPNEHCARILILRDLQNCNVEILAAFQYVVLKNVHNCDVLLGPCHACYCEDLMDTTFAIATGHLLLDTVKRVNLRYCGLVPPRCRDTSGLSEISLAPLGVAYTGMSSDFAACHLPQEHAGTLQIAVRDDESYGFNTGGTRAIEPIQRDWILRNIWRTGFDYPYSHTLAAFGSLFMHQDDNVSDVFLYGEINGKNVNISRIRGGFHSHEDNQSSPSCSPFSSNITRNPFWPSQELTPGNNELKKQIYPIIFIMDIVGDCIIEDCSHCTVFIAASTDSVIVRRCSHMRLFIMGRELLIEDCEFIDVHLFVVDFLFMKNCSNAELFPLALSAPRVEELISAIIDKCTEENQPEVLNAALDKKDIDTLNVPFSRPDDTTCLYIDECNEVHINDRNAVMIMLDFMPSEEPPSRFFYEAYRDKRTMAEWVHVPFIECTWGFSGDKRGSRTLGTLFGTNAIDRNWEKEKTMNEGNSESWKGEEPSLPPVRFHDLVKPSVLRFPGTISGRARSGQLVDVVLERISTGVVHLTEAVGILFIRRCTGPLNILVCAARRVFVEDCEHVTLQTACVSLTAKNCHGCHFALHVNTPPRFIGCSSILTSTLNITSVDFEGFLDRAGVEQQTNQFSTSHIQATEAESPSTVCAPPAGSSADIDDVDTLEKALTILQTPVFVVPPLPGMCLGVKDAAFLDFLEDRVNSEIKRVGFDERLISALGFLSRPRIATPPCVELREDIPAKESPEESSGRTGAEAVSPILPRHVDPLDYKEVSAPLANSPLSFRNEMAPEGETKETESTKSNEVMESGAYKDDYEEEHEEEEETEEEKEEEETEDEKEEEETEDEKEEEETEDEGEEVYRKEDEWEKEEKQEGATLVYSKTPLAPTRDDIANSFVTSSSSWTSLVISDPLVQSRGLKESNELKTKEEVNTKTDSKNEVVEQKSHWQSATPVESSVVVQDNAHIDKKDIVSLSARSKEHITDYGVDTHLCPTEAKPICAADDAAAQQNVTEDPPFVKGEHEIDLVTHRSTTAESFADNHNPSLVIPLEERGISETEKGNFALWGNLVTHMDETEMVQGLLVEVESARKRFQSAKEKYGFSLEDLEQRVRNAVERIQSSV